MASDSLLESYLKLNYCPNIADAQIHPKSWKQISLDRLKSVSLDCVYLVVTTQEHLTQWKHYSLHKDPHKPHYLTGTYDLLYRPYLREQELIAFA
jgi:hypothetical protein